MMADDRDETATVAGRYGIAQRSKSDKIARLRKRLARAKAFSSIEQTQDIVAGILDLLGDEL